jgi:hypothetical protein
MDGGAELISVGQLTSLSARQTSERYTFDALANVEIRECFLVLRRWRQEEKLMHVRLPSTDMEMRRAGSMSNAVRLVAGFSVVAAIAFVSPAHAPAR